jgi:uncharacterized RDD family membrane protein YckC
VATVPPPPPGPVYATFRQRAAAAVVDGGAIGVVSLTVRIAVVAGWALWTLSDPATLESVDVHGEELTTEVEAVVARLLARTALAFALLSVVFNLAYFAWQERRYRGRTLGRRVPNIAVADARTGRTPSTRQVLVRAAAKYLSAAALGAGYLWMLRDPRRQCWHDKLAGTVVVVPPPAAPAPPTAG